GPAEGGVPGERLAGGVGLSRQLRVDGGPRPLRRSRRGLPRPARRPRPRESPAAAPAAFARRDRAFHGRPRLPPLARLLPRQRVRRRSVEESHPSGGDSGPPPPSAPPCRPRPPGPPPSPLGRGGAPPPHPPAPSS